MTEITSSLIVRALDGLSARSAATAENIANAGTPNFRPLRVTFEEALTAAARDGRPMASVQPQIAAAAEGESVRLDLELATASSTALRYSALTELLGRQMQIHSIAISGGQ